MDSAAAVSPESVVKDLLQRLNAESQAAAAASAAEKARIEEPDTPPRTGAGLKLQKANSRGVEAMAMAGLRDAIKSSKALEGLVDAVKGAKMLNLQKSSIGDKGLSALARAFTDGNATKLLHLDLSDNLITEQGLGALADALASGVLSELAYLDISHNTIREEGSGMLATIFHIGRLPSLQDLNLSHCYIGDHGIKNIAAGMQSRHFSSWSLHFLDLSANVFGEEGVVAISQLLSLGRLPYLEHLNLSYNMIGENGASAFAHVLRSGQLSGLIHLLLSRCYLGDGVTPITQAMETGKLPHLQALDLSSNHLGDKGSVAVARALGSGRISKLRTLVLADCGIPPEGIATIAEAMEFGQVSNLHHLDLSSNSTMARSSSSTRRTVTEDDNYSSSRINYSNARKDVGGLALARLIRAGHLDGLQYLDLSKCWMTDDGLLTLGEAMLSSGGHLSKLQCFLLRDNDIRSPERSTRTLVRALMFGHLLELQELDLGHNSLGDDITMALAAQLEEASAGSSGLEYISCPVVRQLRERFWGSKTSVETFLHEGLQFLESRLGVKVKWQQKRQQQQQQKQMQRPRPSNFGRSRSLQINKSQHSSLPSARGFILADENRVQGQTGYDNKLLFNLLLVGAWILAVALTKWKS